MTTFLMKRYFLYPAYLLLYSENRRSLLDQWLKKKDAIAVVPVRPRVPWTWKMVRGWFLQDRDRMIGGYESPHRFGRPWRLGEELGTLDVVRLITYTTILRDPRPSFFSVTPEQPPGTRSRGVLSFCEVSFPLDVQVRANSANCVLLIACHSADALPHAMIWGWWGWCVLANCVMLNMCPSRRNVRAKTCDVNIWHSVHRHGEVSCGVGQWRPCTDNLVNGHTLADRWSHLGVPTGSYKIL